MVSKLYFLFLLSLGAHALPQATGASAAPTVTIASGVLIGKTTTVSNQPSVTAKVNAFLGVPFAKSPPKRFSPPQAPAAWSSPRQATNLAPACIQQFIGTGDTQARLKQYFNNPNGPAPPESEDCLYLNVYAPANSTPDSKKPVLFWLFGGNLQFGTGSLGYYDGSSLAATQDVVVVTINYRTNIFGFSNSPEVATGSQNSGFLDQRFALQWVQQNIARFGGDPAKVTLFGESAGGYSIKQLLANPPSPLPFASAIMESEQAGLFGDGLASYTQVLANFKCTNIQCLRGVSATAIKQYIESNSIVFPPVQGDGTSVRDVRPSISSGRFAKVPIIMGTNLNEFRVFLSVAGVDGNGTAALQYVFDQYKITDPNVRNNILATYSAQGITDLYTVADRIATDLAFTCTTANLASYLVTYGFQVWRYQYDAVFATTTIFPNAGAYHTSEIPEVFGTYAVSNQFGTVTQQQINLSAFMQSTWAGFAQSPIRQPAWTRLGSVLGNDLGALGKDGSSGAQNVPRLSADYACGLYALIEDVAGLSY